MILSGISTQDSDGAYVATSIMRYCAHSCTASADGPPNRARGFRVRRAVAGVRDGRREVRTFGSSVGLPSWSEPRRASFLKGMLPHRACAGGGGARRNGHRVDRRAGRGLAWMPSSSGPDHFGVQFPSFRPCGRHVPTGLAAVEPRASPRLNASRPRPGRPWRGADSSATTRISRSQGGAS